MVGLDDTQSKQPVAEFSQEDEGHDGGDAGVGQENVGRVAHHCQTGPRVALRHQPVETLGHILWGHQTTKVLQTGRDSHEMTRLVFYFLTLMLCLRPSLSSSVVLAPETISVSAQDGQIHL